MDPMARLVLAILFAVGAIPVGHLLAHALRRRSLRWPLAVICSLAAATVTVFVLPTADDEEERAPIIRGTALVYGVVTDEIPSDVVAEMLDRFLTNELNLDVAVRSIDADAVEVLVRESEGIESEIRRIKNLMRRVGPLEFRIVGDIDRFPDECMYADQQIDQTPRIVTDENGEEIGFWADLALQDGSTEEDPRYRISPKELSTALTRTDENGRQQVFMIRDGFDISGKYIRGARVGYDSMGGLCIHFDMSDQGAKRMRGLSSVYLSDPDNQIFYRLGIILNGELMSAPNIMGVISDNGQITGNFTQQEVEDIATVIKNGANELFLRNQQIFEREPRSEQPFLLE